MIVHPDPDGAVAVHPAAHALLAFQLADHWGNRGFPRPSPRSEVLAAVLALADVGAHGGAGSPEAAALERPALDDSYSRWEDAVIRATPMSPYVAFLVSRQVSHLARDRAAVEASRFLTDQHELQTELRGSLLADPRYRQVFAAGNDGVNQAVVRLCWDLALGLLTGTRGAVVLPDLPGKDEPRGLRLRPDGPRCYRLHPWPFQGDRLSVSAHGTLMPGSETGLPAIPGPLVGLPTIRLRWTLRSLSASR